MVTPTSPPNPSARPPYYQFLDRQHPGDYRAQEIAALTHAIRAKENRLVLGLPGIGVSNLLRFLVMRVDLFKREVVFAYLNCNELNHGFEPEPFFAKIAQELIKQGLASQPHSDAYGYDQLKEIVTEFGGDILRRLVIVVDQIDKVAKTEAVAFYDNLKLLTDLNPRVCYIVAADPARVSDVDPQEWLFAGRKLVVGRFNEPDCRVAVAEEARRLGVEFGVEIQQHLADLSGGYAGLLRAVTSAVVEEKLNLADPMPQLIKRLLEREDIQNRCRKVWDYLTADQRAALRNLAHNSPDPITTDTLHWLHDFGLINGSQQLFSPIFQQFVMGQALADTSEAMTPPSLADATPTEAPLEPINIENPTAKKIGNGPEVITAGKLFKGNQEISVSPSELRLIACLLRQPKVYTKDDIAKYVYYEEYALGKVADDARIDSLVRQVRNRLGHAYIKTHRGQGYELKGRK